VSSTTHEAAQYAVPCSLTQSHSHNTLTRHTVTPTKGDDDDDDDDDDDISQGCIIAVITVLKSASADVGSTVHVLYAATGPSLNQPGAHRLSELLYIERTRSASIANVTFRCSTATPSCSDST
jgi:hypothetical protein